MRVDILHALGVQIFRRRGFQVLNALDELDASRWLISSDLLDILVCPASLIRFPECLW